MPNIGYARVSTLEQRLDVQLAELKAAGCETIYEEKASGGRRDRPVFKRMLQSVKPGDTVIVVRMDRLARSLVDMLSTLDRLKAMGVGFRSLRDPIDTTTSAGLLQLQVMGAVAEFERRLTRERVVAGIAMARARGKVGGNPKLRSRDPAALAALQEAHAESYLRRVSASSDGWMPIVLRMREEGKNWAEVTNTVNATLPPGADKWSVMSLPRAARRVAGAAPDHPLLYGKAHERPNKGKSNHFALHVVAGLKRANPDMKLVEICQQMAGMGMMPPRGGGTWHTSSVQHLLQQARAKGLLPEDVRP